MPHSPTLLERHLSKWISQEAGPPRNYKLNGKSYKQALREARPQFRSRKLLRAEPVPKGERSTYMSEIATSLMRDGVSPELTHTLLRDGKHNKFHGREDEEDLIRGLIDWAENEVEEDEDEVDDELQVSGLESLEGKHTSWLWQGWIPKNNLTVLAGRQGAGKSQLCSLIAAKATRGELGAAPTSVLIASFEDSVSETIVPRMQCVRPRKGRVHILRHVMREDGPDILRLPQDAALVAEKAAALGVGLVILDPLSAVLGQGRNYDAHRDADVRRALAPLTAAADKHGFAVLAVMHLRKKKDEEEPMMGVLGSVAFTAAARSVLMMGYPDQEEGDYKDTDRILVHVKCNLGPEQDSRMLSLRPTYTNAGIPTSKVRDKGFTWEGAEHVKVHRGTEKKLTAAVNLLYKDLHGKERVLAADVKYHAAEQGISERTLRRARNKVGVKVIPAEGRGGRAYYELLPGHEQA